MSDRKPPRFPYVAALLCAACLGAAVWTWMRCSYAWEVEPINCFVRHSEPNPWIPYFCYRRLVVERDAHFRLGMPRAEKGNLFSDPWTELQEEHEKYVTGLWVGVAKDPAVDLLVSQKDALAIAQNRCDRRVWTGRITYGYPHGPAPNWTLLDTTASRFTGESIAGLVVGAMGVFVFAVALRYWLKERRGFREEARA